MTFEGHVSDLFTVVTLCAQMTRDLLAMAKFVVFYIGLYSSSTKHGMQQYDKTSSHQTIHGSYV